MFWNQVVLGAEKAKRSSKTSPNRWSLIVDLGRTKDYPIELTPGRKKGNY